MPSVADLVEEPTLSNLASTQALGLGTELADTGKVRFGVFGPLHVTAVVDEDDEHVELRSAGGKLEWSCTCPDGRVGTFCRHAVAVAVETWRRAPARRDHPAG